MEVAVKEFTVPAVTLGVGKNPDRHVTEVVCTTWSVYCMALAHFQRRAGAQGLFAHPALLVDNTGSCSRESRDTQPSVSSHQWHVSHLLGNTALS